MSKYKVWTHDGSTAKTVEVTGVAMKVVNDDLHVYDSPNQSDSSCVAVFNDKVWFYGERIEK